MPFLIKFLNWSWLYLWFKLIYEDYLDKLTILIYFIDYDVKRYEGSKSVVLSTAGSYGGKNDFISIAYIIYSFITFLFSIKFFLLYRK